MTKLKKNKNVVVYIYQKQRNIVVYIDNKKGNISVYIDYKRNVVVYPKTKKQMYITFSLLSPKILVQ